MTFFFSLSHYFRRSYVQFAPTLKAGFHMIADDRGSQIEKSSAIVCDHMETHFCDRLRSIEWFRTKRAYDVFRAASFGANPSKVDFDAAQT